jgi:putative sterol carrier protein
VRLVAAVADPNLPVASVTRMIRCCAETKCERCETMAGMADSTTDFFDALGRRGYEPLLRKLSGAVRFEIRDGKRVERRYVTVGKGSVTVSGRGARTQTVVRADRAVFGRIAAGELNPVAAVLRGELEVEGDWRLLVLVQRLFPSPPRKKASRRMAGYAKRR